MALGVMKKRNKEINKVVLLPIKDIVSNPNQPRRVFHPEELRELSESIEANGLLQPVTVRKNQIGKYELIAGERRTMAFLSLGREVIPAIVEDLSEKQSAVMSLIENLQRKDLNCFEEAAAIERLMDQLGLTQQQVSAKIGKAQSTVANKLRLLRFPHGLQELIVSAGLTERHARALLKLDGNESLHIAVEYIIEHGYNVAQTEQYVEKQLAKSNRKESTRLFIIKDMRMFQNSIQKAVNMMNLAGIPVKNMKREDDDYIEYKIRVPKAAVLREREEREEKKFSKLIKQSV